MARYAGQKRRVTTSKTYAMDGDYNKVLQDAKRLHRYDGEFYIVMIYGVYSSVSIRDYQTYKYNGDIEHWKFENRRWKKIENWSDIMKKYAIWKNHKVIGYIELTEEQKQTLNGIPGIGVHFGFDKTTQPDKYAKNFTKKCEKTL